jgi:hypothetical protein
MKLTSAFLLSALWMSTVATAQAAGAAAAADSAASAPSLTQAIINLKGNKAVSDVISQLTEDVPMTTAPANYVLGVSGSEVPRYTTFRTFATGVQRAVGKDGKIANAVSAEIAPLLALEVLTLEDQTNWAMRALSRTTFSIATVAGAGDKSASSAYGLHSVLYSRELDRAIDMVATNECRTAGKDYLDSLPPVGGSVGTGVPASPKPLTAEQRAKVEKCQTAIDSILNRWNQTMVAVGFGQAFKSTENKASTLKRANKVAWLTGSWGFGSGESKDANERVGGLLTAHARSERDGIADTPAAATPQSLEDANLYGISLRVGKARFNGLIEHSRRTSKIAGLVDERRQRTVVGLEYRLQKDLYIDFGIGSESGRRDGKNSGMALANLKWGFGGKPMLTP